MASGLLFAFILCFVGSVVTDQSRSDLDNIKVLSQKTKCPTGWIGFGNRCFLIHREIDTWHDAEAYCKSVGGHLASVHTAEENSFLSKELIKLYNMKNYKGYIGLHLSEEETFVWSDGSAVDYVNWAPGQPNNDRGIERCTVINYQEGMWNDVACLLRLPYICSGPKECPTGWMAHGARCFHFHTEQKTGKEAEEFCKVGGGHLASVHSAEENRFFKDKMFELNKRHVTYYIGLYVSKKGTHVWSDGTAVDYKNWAPGEPNNYIGFEHCTVMRFQDERWNDVTCGFDFPFICSS